MSKRVIGPKSLRSAANTASAALVLALCQKIDQALEQERDFQGEVRVQVSSLPGEAVLNQLRRRYCEDSNDPWGSITTKSYGGDFRDQSPDTYYIILSEHSLPNRGGGDDRW